MSDKTTMKIFVIGFNKTATRTIHHFFRNNDVPSVHWDTGKLAKHISRNIQEGKNPIEGYENYTAFSDMSVLNANKGLCIEGCRNYQSLYNWNPDSKFILNTRSVDTWIQSRLNHANGRFVDRYMKCCGVPTREEMVEQWRKDHHEHHNEVLSFFGDKKEQLLVFNIETDAPESICRFLSDSFNLDPALWKTMGVTPKPENRALEDNTLANITPEEYEALVSFLKSRTSRK